MKIFGRGKDNDAVQDGDDFDTAVADDAGFDDTDDAGLSATPGGRMGLGGGGGSKKKILILFVLLLVGGGFAGMMMMGGSDTPPPLAAVEATMPPATPLDPNAVPPADMAAAQTDTGMPPMPEMPPMPAPVDGTQAGAIDPMTGVPMVQQPADPMAADPMADPMMAGVDPLAPVTIDPVTGQPVAPAADPLTAAVATPMDATDPMAAPPADPLAPVDAIDAEAGTGADNMIEAPAMPGAAMPVDATASTTSTTTTTTTTTPVDGAAGPVDGVADATATTTSTSTTTTTTAVDPAATGEAEGAVVDNADMVDAAEPEMMPVPRTPEDIANLWAQLPVEQAVVRPLPDQYLTVKKEQAAESLDSRLATARRALNDGRTAAALQFFNELRMDYPNDTRVLMGRAVTLQRLGQNAEALEGYEDVLVNDPKNLDALTNMLGLIKQQNPQLALEKLTDLRNLYPYNGDITTQLAVAHGQMGNLNESLRYITLAEALKPESSYVLYNKAVLYDRLGRTTEAADMYRTLVRRSADGTLDQALPIESIKSRLATIR